MNQQFRALALQRHKKSLQRVTIKETDDQLIRDMPVIQLSNSDLTKLEDFSEFQSATKVFLDGNKIAEFVPQRNDVMEEIFL